MIHVLIVEDDPMVAELNKSYLNRIEGFKLAGVVANGQEALDFLEKNLVSLLLLDVFMPQLDGLSLLQKIRKTYPSVDVIMVTAARNSCDIQAALRQGAVDYVIKPFEFQRLESALLSYRERFLLLSVNDPLDQSMIDRRIFTQKPSKPTMPKGLENETLSRIRETIQSQCAPFSVQDLAPKVNLSRISLKKYLDFLLEEGFLKATLTYRGTGRPVLLYSRH